MTGRRGNRRKQPLDDLKKRGEYGIFKEEALDRTLWRSRFGRDCESVVRLMVMLVVVMVTVGMMIMMMISYH